MITIIVAVLALLAGLFSLFLSVPAVGYVAKGFYITLGIFLIATGILALV